MAPSPEVSFLHTLIKDIRYAIRSLLRQPSLALVAIVTLALGIGANTAVFSVVKAVLLNPLPYDSPEELAVVWTNFGRDLPQNWVSGPEFVEIQRLATTIQDFEAVVFNSASITGDGEPEQVSMGLVSGKFFPLLGTTPQQGRLIQEPDDVPGSTPVVALSHGFWQRRYGGDPGIVGTTINVSGFPIPVVGVLPPGFAILHPDARAPEGVDIWVPMTPILPTVFGVGQYDKLPRGSHFMSAIARMKPGVTLDQLQADLDSVAVQMAEISPRYYSFEGWGLTAISMHEDLVEEVKPALLVLMGAVGFVLLIACVNVANLLLARAAAREREIAIRTALGAGRGRLFRQLLTESITLAGIGSLAGLGVAAGLMELLRVFSPAGLPRGGAVAIDSGVMIFTLAAGLGTGVLFGLAPVIHGFREQLVESLKEGGRGTSTGVRSRLLRTGLVVSEVALALVLLIGAGLMIKSFNQLLQTDPGYEVENRLTMQINLPQSKYPNAQSISAFQGQLLEQVGGLPGVSATGLISHLPLSGAYSSGTTRVRESQTVPEDQRAIEIDRRQVSPTYFETMGVRLVGGRFFADADRSGAPLVAMVDEEFVNRFWPSENPVGQYVSINSNQDGRVWREVVGVVAHSKHYNLDSVGREQVYFPLAQASNGNTFLCVRTSQDPIRMASAVRTQHLDALCFVRVHDKPISHGALHWRQVGAISWVPRWTD